MWIQPCDPSSRAPQLPLPFLGLRVFWCEARGYSQWVGHHLGRAASWQSLGPCPPPGLSLPLPPRVSFQFHSRVDVTAEISCSVIQLEAVSSPTRTLPHASKCRECGEEELAQTRDPPPPHTSPCGLRGRPHLNSVQLSKLLSPPLLLTFNLAPGACCP